MSPAHSNSQEAVRPGRLQSERDLFRKHEGFIVHREGPFNGGPALEVLRQSFLTPEHAFFVRNHGTVPQIDPRDYRLTVAGDVEKRLELSLEDLQKNFPVVTVGTSLMCAGIRRKEFEAVRPIPGEVPWGPEAVSNAEWRGARLRDVLEAARVVLRSRHVEFTGLDAVSRDGRSFGFGGSVPMEKALGEDVLLAWEMNGQPLPPTHGFPLRAVVPGYIGARSVKWLQQITVRREPSENYFQVRAYKLFPPSVHSEPKDPQAGVMLGEQFTNIGVCSPPLEKLESALGPVRLEGYALGGNGREVQRVELSLDEGANWTPARIAQRGSRWQWCFWEAELDLQPEHEGILVRAWDNHDVQPGDPADLWNYKGYMNNSWFRVRFRRPR